jgi:hypothetical protein
MTPQIAPLNTPSPFFSERGFGIPDTSRVPLPYLEQPISPNDNDFYRAITAEELKARMRVSIHNFFANKQ